MVRSQDQTREPCPDRIIDDLGGAFAMGTLGGSMWHFMKGTYNGPKGHRFHHGFQTMRMNAPAVGGGFAAWGGLFSICDCSLVFLRQKEDPWNSIIAGAATGGILSMRRGLGPVTTSAVSGAIFLAGIEGVQFMINAISIQICFHRWKVTFPIFTDHHQCLAKVLSWRRHRNRHHHGLGGLFGGNDKKKEETSSGSKTEILESFDTPSPPTFEFK